MRIKFNRRLWLWTTALLAASKLFLILLCGMTSFHLAKTEMYTAMVDIEVLIETELITLRKFNSFVTEQNKNLYNLKR